MLPRQEIEPARRIRGRSRRDAALATIAVGATLALGGAGAALAIAAPDASTGPDEPAADVPALDHDSQFERSLGVGVARVRYGKLYDKADRLDVEPDRNLAGTTAGRTALAAGSDELRKEIEAEKKRLAAKPEFGTPESVGIDQATLDAIAACESGGDPTAVDASGTYHGKYQFDLQTWASVGGSGDPAAASEAEQDYRAELLMSRAGSSPWPVCG
jgi:Transglycosylase-like domain